MIFFTCKMGIMRYVFIKLMFGSTFLGSMVLHVQCLSVIMKIRNLVGQALLYK